MNIAHGNNVPLTEKHLKRIKQKREAGISWGRIALTLGMSQKALRERMRALGWGDLQ